MAIILKKIVKIIDDEFNIEMKNITRHMDVNYARHAYCNALRKWHTTTAIAKSINRNHATIVHYMRGHVELTRIEWYNNIYKRVRDLHEELSENQPYSVDDVLMEVQTIKERLVYLENYLIKLGGAELQPEVVR
jgi:hypothetical protein